MPRMQVYLPDDLYKVVKKSRLPASELLQEAVRAEVRRRGLLEAADGYLEKLTAEVGKPSARQLSKARSLASGIAQRSRKKAG